MTRALFLLFSPRTLNIAATTRHPSERPACIDRALSFADRSGQTASPWFRPISPFRLPGQLFLLRCHGIAPHTNRPPCPAEAVSEDSIVTAARAELLVSAKAFDRISPPCCCESRGPQSTA